MMVAGYAVYTCTYASHFWHSADAPPKQAHPVHITSGCLTHTSPPSSLSAASRTRNPSPLLPLQNIPLPRPDPITRLNLQVLTQPSTNAHHITLHYSWVCVRPDSIIDVEDNSPTRLSYRMMRLLTNNVEGMVRESHYVAVLTITACFTNPVMHLDDSQDMTR